jgi:hypothetical protein
VQITFHKNKKKKGEIVENRQSSCTLPVNPGLLGRPPVLPPVGPRDLGGLSAALIALTGGGAVQGWDWSGVGDVVLVIWKGEGW